LLTDPFFYFASVPAVLLYGVAKGGFGGAVAVLSVPMMALVMSPTQAAAILLPKKLSPLLFAGTAGMFFAIVNVVKLFPFYILGQFTTDNLLYSLALVPLAPLGVKLGHYLVTRSDSGLYYRVISFS
jgi:uncharacterized membrane protein YfcA